MESFDEVGFSTIIERHWTYHTQCKHIRWQFQMLDSQTVKIEAAPAFQEVFGGQGDGKKVWVGYEFDLTELSQEPDLEITEIGYRTYCNDCTPVPFVGIRGSYRSKQFALMLYLEPIPDSEIKEIYDAINDEVRDIQ